MSKRGGQGRREREKSIRSLEARIAEHRQHLEDEPNAPAADKWKKEIAHFQRLIREHRERLGNDGD